MEVMYPLTDLVLGMCHHPLSCLLARYHVMGHTRLKPYEKDKALRMVKNVTEGTWVFEQLLGAVQPLGWTVHFRLSDEREIHFCLLEATRCVLVRLGFSNKESC